MSELESVLVLLVGVGALGATGGLVAACLRLRSPIEFLLASYLVAWLWLVSLTLLLSPGRWVTRGSLLGGLAIGLGVALFGWLRVGRPAPPGIRTAFRSARTAIRARPTAVLAFAVALGLVYIGALAFLTPSNDMDALEYHLARAAFWRQQHGLGYIDHVDDARVNLFPPNAEIGQLATMLLAGRDRYAALPQLLAFPALVLSVAGLARRASLSTGEAVFGALAFATLPIVVVQAPSTMNDLVVASFLGASAYFGLRSGRATTVLLVVGLALAIGTKYTAIIALPALAFMLAVRHPPRRWPVYVGAMAAGCIGGSVWLAVNLVETGGVGTDVPNQPQQRAEIALAPVAVMVLRLATSFVDMSGAPGPYALAFVVAAAVLLAAGLIELRRSRGGGGPLVAAGLTAMVVAIPLLWEIVVRVTFRLALLLGGRDLVDRFGWILNTKAEPLVGGYGPLALLLVISASVMVAAMWRRGELPAIAAALAVTPLVLVAAVAVTLTYDVTRMRFLLFGVAAAAATWGLALRNRPIAYATAAIGSTALFLGLANYNGKPSGLFQASSIWTMPRWQAQTTRNGLGADVLAFVNARVPADARLALSVVGDDWIHPFFGPELDRQLTLVSPRGGSAPDDAEWLVLGPHAVVERCPGSWTKEFANAPGWRVERRLEDDDCDEERA